MDNRALRLEMVHLQLTRQCNLNCWFCGQRKKKKSPGEDERKMKLADWMRVLDQLDAMARKSQIRPCAMLWGGEAVLNRDFPVLVKSLKERGYRIGMITNGTLLEPYRELVDASFETLYFSIDGPEQIHDRIRGAGAFQKAAGAIRTLTRAKRILTAVLTEETAACLDHMLDTFLALRPDGILLQERIVLTGEEMAAYEEWMREDFGKNAPEIHAWGAGEDWQAQRQEIDRRVREVLERRTFPCPVSYLPHIPANAGIPALYKDGSLPPCLSPFRHLHITWDGQVMYCTDFTDFSAGNVKEEPLWDIWENEASRRFRKAVQEGRCPSCSHCSWRYKTNFLEL